MGKRGLLMWLFVLAAYLAGADAKGGDSGPGRVENRDGEETVVFFIPEDPDNEVSAYIYDSERNHLLVCSDYDGMPPAGAPKNRNTDQWIVLPGNVRAYTSPSLDARMSAIVLSYPQEIESDPSDFVKSDGTEWVAFRHNDTVFYLPAPLLAKRGISGLPGDGNLRIGSEAVDRHTALPPGYKPNDLVPVDQRWNYHTREYPKYLRTEAARAIEDMLAAARAQGIQIRIFSAYRSYAKQRYLYLRKIDKDGLNQILVAKPGHSEHQLGTAVDLCGLDPASVASAGFGTTREGSWLRSNCDHYGFVESYRKDNMEEHGYALEPWHYRYMGLPTLKSNQTKPMKGGR